MIDNDLIKRVAKAAGWLWHGALGQWRTPDAVVCVQYSGVIQDIWRLTDSGLRVIEDALVRAGCGFDMNNERGLFVWSRARPAMYEAANTRELAACVAYLKLRETTPKQDEGTSQ